MRKPHRSSLVVLAVLLAILGLWNLAAGLLGLPTHVVLHSDPSGSLELRLGDGQYVTGFTFLLVGALFLAVAWSEPGTWRWGRAILIAVVASALASIVSQNVLWPVGTEAEHRVLRDALGNIGPVAAIADFVVRSLLRRREALIAERQSRAL